MTHRSAFVERRSSPPPRTRPTPRAAWCWVGLATLACSPALAQRFIVDLDDPNFMPYAMAVPEITPLEAESPDRGTHGKTLAEVLRNDLDISEAFTVIPRIAYLAPDNEPWTNPSFPDWVKVGAAGLVRAAYKLDGSGGVKVTFRLYDVVAQREALVKHYEGPVADERRLVHRFADDLYHFFTGKRSIFFTRLAFVSHPPSGGGTTIWTCDFDGANLKPAVDNGSLNLLPSFSRDGRTLLYTSYVRDNPDLFAQDLLSGEVKVLSNRRGLNIGAAYAPDGKRIAFTLSKDGNTEIYVLDVASGEITRLTRFWGEDISPTFSPDGKRLAFVSSRSGHPQIYVMNASDGSEVRRLTFQGNYNTEPDWSPRPGGKIVFTARDERLQFDLFLVDPESGEISRLTQDQGSNEGPAFSPDGRYIVFTSTRLAGQRKIFMMTADGGNQRLIVDRRGDVETPAWSLVAE